MGLSALLVVLCLAVTGGARPLVRRLTRRLEALEQGVEAFGASALLRRALRNLLENALRYGGGDVLASVQRLPTGGAEVRVRDRGPGVPDAHRERIFGAVFRLPAHAEREGGVGLALLPVRQIAECHGGRVRCEPRVRGGSCFLLELPLG